MIFLYLVITLLIFTILLYFEKKILYSLKYVYHEKHMIHEYQTLRVGGIGTFIGLLLIYLYADINNILYFLIYFTPIFFFSIFEDLFGNTRASLRLISIFISSVIYIIFVGTINNLDISANFVNNYYFLALLTVIAISAITNSFNFIDGLNGLAIFSYISIITSLFVVLYFNNGTVNNNLLFFICIPLPFLIFNFPTGKFFLGDTGAYLLGFISSIVVIDYFNYYEIFYSWSAVLIFSYPISETLFTIIRRIISKKSPIEPDSYHLHTLIYKLLKDKLKIKNAYINSASTIFMLPIFSAGPIANCLFYGNLNMTVISIFAFIIMYLCIYLFIFVKIK